MGAIALVGLAQVIVSTNSIYQAGLVKQAVLKNGQWWRLATAPFLHADIIGVLLERKTENAEFFAFKHPESLSDLLDEPLHLIVVDPLNLFEQVETISQLLGNLDECAEVLWKTTAAEPEGGIQKFSSDANVHSHGEGKDQD